MHTCEKKTINEEENCVAPLLGSLKDAQMLFSGEKVGSPYLRGGHARIDPLETKVAEIESGLSGFVASSGQAITHLVFSTLLRPGDHLISSFRLFGGTYALFVEHFVKELGVEISWFDPAKPSQLPELFCQKTKAVFCESISNPDGVIADLEAISVHARAHGVPFIVDNTLGFGMCSPLSHGACGVTLSLTKYASGKNRVILGAFVDSGTFVFDQNPKFSDLFATEALRSPCVLASLVRKRSVLFGPTPSIQDASMVLESLQTLQERWQKHLANAEALFDFLSKHPSVLWISYPSLDGDQANKERAEKYFSGRGGAVIFFALKGGEEGIACLIDRLKRVAHRANIGQEESIITVPDQTTHRQIPPELKSQMRITPTSIRLSVGVEPLEEILSDLRQALGSG